VVTLGRVPGSEDQYADVARHPQNTEVPGVTVLRVDGGLFFANSDAVRAQVRRHASEPETRAIVLDGEDMPFLDVTAARMLDDLRDDLRRDGVELLLARDVGQVRDVLRTTGDRSHVYPTVRAAVDAAAAPRQDSSR
jgi:anti-anti-sigma factor